MQSLNVDLGERSYPIYIGAELLKKPELLARHIKGKQVFVVTNTTVGSLYRKQLEQSLHQYQADFLELPDGEQYKNFESLQLIFDALLKKGYNRDVTLIALGGGVIGDITGFAAASYQRGVDFIQIPTTLLAQVDSSVGGKTAVNHALGKNMIGAFYQPQAVIADLSTLKTLPDRELSAGLAEVIKYGLIADKGFFEWIELNIEGLLQQRPELLSAAIELSCANKARIVAADEREKGQRALLNLGHTFGHAIETHVKYEGWLHGEAVATGMLMAAQLSALHDWIQEHDVERIKELLQAARLPIKPPPNMTGKHFMQLMAHDKKVINSKIRFILLKQIGQAVISEDYDPALLETCLSLSTQE